MPYAIELLFDDASNQTINAARLKLETVGLLKDCSHAPHISLSVCEEINVPIYRDILAEFARHTTPFTLDLSHLGIFLPGVLFLGVTIPRQLVTLHNEFHYDFIQYGKDIWEYYTPSQWIPHCTLVDKLTATEMPQAVEIVQSIALPIRVAVQRVGIFDIAAWQQVDVFPLRGLYETGIDEG